MPSVPRGRHGARRATLRAGRVGGLITADERKDPTETEWEYLRRVVQGEPAAPAWLVVGRLAAVLGELTGEQRQALAAALSG